METCKTYTGRHTRANIRVCVHERDAICAQGGTWLKQREEQEANWQKKKKKILTNLQPFKLCKSSKLSLTCVGEPGCITTSDCEKQLSLPLCDMTSTVMQEAWAEEPAGNRSSIVCLFFNSRHMCAPPGQWFEH